MLDHDLLHRSLVAEAHALPSCQAFQRERKPVHAAFHQPHPARLDMCDQHQRRRRREGRRAAIGRVAAEQLLQPRVAEIAAKGAPQGGVRAQRAIITEAGEAHPPAEPQRIDLGVAQERPVERVVEPLRLRPERTKAARLLYPGKGADGILAGLRIGEEVEPGIAPSVTRKDLRPAGRKVIVERLAACGEHTREHVTQGEHGRAGIDRGAVDRDRAQLAAGSGGRLDDRDVESPCGEQCGGNEPANTRSDHYHALVSHAPPPIDETLTSVHFYGHMNSSVLTLAHLRLALWRNRVIGSARFQRFASHFPLTRPTARRRARALFDLVAGFTYSQTLAACIETGLIELLAGAPLPTKAIAQRIAMPESSTERLLRAAAAIGLVERVGVVWLLGPQGAALRGNPGIAEMVAHHHLLYADLADPVALFRRGGGGGVLSRHWRYAEEGGCGTADEVEPYSTLMAASQPLVAEQVLDAYPIARHRRLLDIGGGEGAFLAAAGLRAPKLELALFDLPAVVDRAQARLAAAGLSDRATVIGGNFLVDPLPADHDLITLVRVLHDHDDAPALALLRAIRTALPPGGRLLVAEPMAGTPGAEPAGDSYFGLYLLAMGSGRPRTPGEIVAMLRDAGFTSSRLVGTALPLTVRVIVATR